MINKQPPIPFIRAQCSVTYISYISHVSEAHGYLSGDFSTTAVCPRRKVRNIPNILSEVITYNITCRLIFLRAS